MSQASLRAARGLQECGRGRAGRVRWPPGAGVARGRRGGGGGGGPPGGPGVFSFLSCGGGRGEGRSGRPALPLSRLRFHLVRPSRGPQVFRGEGSCLCPARFLLLLFCSPWLRCAALAPHVLFGWVSNGGRGGSAAGRRLQGGANLGPRATAWGKHGRYPPSGDVSPSLPPN